MSNYRLATFPLKKTRLFSECKSQIEWSFRPSVYFSLCSDLFAHWFFVDSSFSWFKCDFIMKGERERELKRKSILHTVTFILFWAVIYEMREHFWDPCMKIVQHCILSCPKESSVCPSVWPLSPLSGQSWVYTGPQSPAGLFGHAVCVCVQWNKEEERVCMCVVCRFLKATD